MQPADPIFEEHRPALERLAYRMLGSLADADDVLQEAYLRWSRADRTHVAAPRAYLLSLVTRLCLDQWRTVAARKEGYIGPWLPEPVVEDDDPAARQETADAVSLAFLVVLESLGPEERAAYLLRRVFDYDYEEIARVLDKTSVACRQLVSRAEARIHAQRPRFEPAPDEAARLTQAFLAACVTGDLEGMLQLLAPDAVAISDGGGKVAAALAPIEGADRVARFFLGITKKRPPNAEFRSVRVNGLPGILVVDEGQVLNILTLDVNAGRIAACFVIRNPDKLKRVSATERAGVRPEA